MHSLIKDHIEALHLEDVKIVLAIAGSGTKALSWIMEIPGASNTVLEAVVPYSETSMADLIGGFPEKFVSEQTAISMARAAYFRGTNQRATTQKVVGISCTAALTTNRERRGSNQAYIGLYGDDFLKVYHLEISKDNFDRAQEEIIVSEYLIDTMVFELLHKREPLKSRDSTYISEINSLTYESYEQALLAGHVKSVQVDVNGVKIADQKYSGGILSGSFNPVHDGHLKLASTAKDILRGNIAFEISVANVDKPNLPVHVIKERADQFVGNSTLLLTVAPLFSNKAVLYPESTFIIGWDTAVRLVDQQYYEGSMRKMYKSLEQIEHNGSKFLVAGRCLNRQFMSLRDVSVPDRFKALFTEIPESKFRMDISSSDIRTS